MKILVLTSRLPWPLDKGDKLRAFHLIRHLSTEHEIYLFSLSESDPDEEALQALQPFLMDACIVKVSRWRRLLRMGRALFSSKPFQTHWFFQRPAQKRLQAWQSTVRPDVVLCQLVRMAEYVRESHDVPRVLDYMDALSVGIARQSHLVSPWIRWIYRMEFRRLQAYEATVFDYFDAHAIISKADRKLIRHPEHQLIEVVPNGIDTAFFKKSAVEPMGEIRPPSILFTGNMSYPPNVDAAVQLVEQIVPHLRTPDVHVIIAGTEPDLRVQRLASDRVTVTGWLPDIRTAYRDADVFVAPLRIGTGQQNKILEAMAMELPCVTTQHVLSGFPQFSSDGPPMIATDSSKRLAAEIDGLLDDADAREKLGRLSRSWVEKHCDWHQSAQKLAHTFVHSIHDQPEENVWHRTTSA